MMYTFESRSPCLPNCRGSRYIIDTERSASPTPDGNCETQSMRMKRREIGLHDIINFRSTELPEESGNCYLHPASVNRQCRADEWRTRVRECSIFGGR